MNRPRHTRNLPRARPEGPSRKAVVWLAATLLCYRTRLGAARGERGNTASPAVSTLITASQPSDSCVIWYCSSFLYKLLRGVSIASAVFEIFHPFSRSFDTR
jgi:hypothetical protein